MDERSIINFPHDSISELFPSSIFLPSFIFFSLYSLSQLFFFFFSKFLIDMTLDLMSFSL